MGTRARLTAWGLAGLLGLAVPAAARADGPCAAPAPARPAPDLGPRSTVVYRALLGGRVNPLGAVLRLDLGYHLRLYDSDAMLLKGSYLGIEAIPLITPSYYMAGGAVVLQPLAVLRLSATFEHIGYFGTWNEVAAYPGPSADYSPAARSARGAAGLTYPAQGNRITFAALLQAKVGPIAARNNLRVLRVDMALKPGDTVFYDSILDSLDPAHGWLFVDDADLVWLGQKDWVLGLRYTVTTTYQGAGRTQTTQRVGPLVTWTLPGFDHGLIQKPTGILIVNWWLEHPYRDGQEVTALIPYLAIAVRVQGDVL